MLLNIEGFQSLRDGCDQMLIDGWYRNRFFVKCLCLRMSSNEAD